MIIHSEDQKAKLHAEIARRYAKLKKGRRRHCSVASLRLRELNNLATAWFGPELPDDDEGRCFARVVANHLAELSGNLAQRFETWSELRAPWLDADEFDEIVELAQLSPTRYTADSLAHAIGLDWDTRERLRINTIGAIDVDKEERGVRQKQKRAAGDAARRRLKGATPRSQSKARTKPWKAVGMSRSAWYRAGKPTVTLSGVTP